MITLFGLVWGIHSASAQSAPRPPDTDERVAAFEAETGLDLHIMGDRNEPEPIADPGSQGPADPALVLAHLDTIEDVMMQYPASVRGGIITDLYVLGKLQMGGVPFLGSARPDKKAFILAVRPRSTAASLRSTLHHELAHLIELNDAFDAEAWVAASGPYNGRLRDQTTNKGLDIEVWWSQGFASRYASKNRHEDFAELAEFGFTQPRRMTDVAEKYPIIGQKVELMTKAYDQFAPGMDLPWVDGTPTPPPEVAPPPQPPTDRPAEPTEPVTTADSTNDAGAPTRVRPPATIDDKGNPVRRPRS